MPLKGDNMESIEKFSTIGRPDSTIRAFGFLYEAAVAQFSKERVETKNISIDFSNGFGALAGEVKESEEVTESEFYVTDPLFDEETGKLSLPMTTSIRLRGKNRSLYRLAILLSYEGEPISLVIHYFSPETTARYAIENGVKG